MRYFQTFVFAAFSIVYFSSCVSQQDFQACEERLSYFQAEALKLDSVTNVNRELSDDKRSSDALLKQTLGDLESLTAANLSLNKSYQDLLKEYSNLIDESDEILTTTSYEKLTLQEQLSAQQADLETKNKEIYEKDFQLYRSAERLNETDEFGLKSPTGYSQIPTGMSSSQVSQLVQRYNIQLQQIHNQLYTVLRTYGANATVVTQEGKVIVSLSQNLLFGINQNNTTLEWNGQKALQQIAKVVNSFSDTQILIKGQGSSNSNWEESLGKANSVLKAFADNGVLPQRLASAGQTAYAKTDIVISPNLDELYQAVSQN